ncbi:PTS mannose/fructose/sorbose transporter subunit IIB [Tetragenococcus osmophilus]|uniref:PTS mannose transporter subunit IID n=1 Tax=Tetragenococcus osmophilus TaxID=526944 RepID=A0AA37XKR2_9ENTE|nr:PTS sugar transporter subunit IIB [Tetragenococcus osmophilus]AYW48274.1 PTS mannose/fructose/sorbose transporter subunit IIB [Tetragenococcus osmophilus]GMA54073.1 PTS mannose transporter subunit IID [Alicyclobacillus contaminans]GMA72036.1 PTS mannose transporter subunit IID [Tetragenococcus osmophilus]
MGNIVYTRIDDRLVHGQVMTAWVQVTKANEVLIVDDDVAKDTFLQMVMKSAMPNKVSLKVVTINEVKDYIENQEKGKNIFILVKTPLTVERLHEQEVNIQSLGVGGMGAREDRKTLYRNISASDEEKRALIHLNELGVDVFFQVTPDNTKVRLSNVLKGA